MTGITEQQIIYWSKGLPDGDEAAKFGHPSGTLRTKLVDELSDLAEGFVFNCVACLLPSVSRLQLLIPTQQLLETAGGCTICVYASPACHEGLSTRILIL